MCWVHEWAKAINSIEWAKIHVERARIKVKKRGLGGATQECDKLIDTLQASQDQLKSLIEKYGIFKTNDAESLIHSMTSGRTKAGKIEAWVKTN